MKKLATIIALTVALALSLAFVACEPVEKTDNAANDSDTQSVSSSVGGGTSYDSSTEQSGGSSSGSSGQGGDSTEINDLSQYTNTLYVEDNKDFVILNFTDFQLHDGKSTYTAFDIIDTLVDNYHPDLITVLGDTAEDDGTYGTKVNFKAIVDHIDALGIPWAPVYGNHDNDN